MMSVKSGIVVEEPVAGETKFSKARRQSETQQKEEFGAVEAEHFLEATLFNPNADGREIGRILVESGKLSEGDVVRIAEYQHHEGIFFGEAALKLKLIKQPDIDYALAKQFNYTYFKASDGIFSEELVTAYQPFSKKSEIFRSIRSQLSLNWLARGKKIISIVSPSSGDGKSFIAANLAVLFAQENKRTLLIDGDLRSPRQQKIFNYRCQVGFSAMLAGRVSKSDLDRLPESIPFFTNFSVLGVGAIPPNPLELLAGERLYRITRELGESYFDVIIIDTPAANDQSDYQPLSACAGSSIVVTRKNQTKIADVKKLVQSLNGSNVEVVGTVINEY